MWEQTGCDVRGRRSRNCGNGPEVNDPTKWRSHLRHFVGSLGFIEAAMSMFASEKSRTRIAVAMGMLEYVFFDSAASLFFAAKLVFARARTLVLPKMPSGRQGFGIFVWYKEALKEPGPVQKEDIRCC